MTTLELQNVTYTYQTQYQKVDALKGISHCFDAGLLHAVVGRSGSGKTTLLSLMAGLDLPTSGEVLCGGVSTAAMSLEQYRREKVAVIYQSFRLFPLLTVAENVMYPPGQRADGAVHRADPASDPDAGAGTGDVGLLQRHAGGDGRDVHLRGAAGVSGAGLPRRQRGR